MDGRTDTPSYRDATAHLKIERYMNDIDCTNLCSPGRRNLTASVSAVPKNAGLAPKYPRCSSKQKNKLDFSKRLSIILYMRNHFTNVSRMEEPWYIRNKDEDEDHVKKIKSHDDDLYTF